MSLKPDKVHVYHVFLASPGDVSVERQHVRRFFDDYNRHTAHLWNAEFRLVDWENYSTIGVGRPQELITQQTLEKFKDSLALVVGIMAQRFGTPSGKAESGTEEEFNHAKQCHDAHGVPEIKWFFRKIDKLELPADPDEADKALDQWKQVRTFRKRMQDLNDPVFYTEYPSPEGFARVFDHDLNLWLNDAGRPWAKQRSAAGRAGIAGELPVEFNSEKYRAAVLKRFDGLNFEMLDTTGAYYSGVRLWSVFVPQSARECHQYNPRLLEIPKEHQERLLKSGEIDKKELADAQKQSEQLRQEYFQQPLRPVLEVVDQALQNWSSREKHRLVILGDPGSGKSSLIRYLALRWANIADRTMRDTQPIPLVIELGAYARWDCAGKKGIVRYLEEGPVWHEWPSGLLAQLLAQPGRIVLLLDGLDEVFDPQLREEVVNDIQRFSTEHAQTPIMLTSRIVGYQSQRLRDAEFQHFMLQDLDTAQIDTFLERWHDQTFDDPAQAATKHERLKKAIRESKAIAMLAGNPLLLTMMAILNRNQELPRDRVDLYAQATRLLLHQWDTEHSLTDFPGLSADIGWREKHDILRRVASFMQAGPGGLKGNMIDGPPLEVLIEDYLHTERNFPQSRAAARAVVAHLRQRNFILCFVGADSYGFVHRTFLEYFCAAEIVHQFNIAKTLNVTGLLSLFDQHCRDDDWREVLRLICSQIDEQFVGQVIERLAGPIQVTWDGKTPRPELPLAISCLSEAGASLKLTTAGDALLRKCITVFEGPGYFTSRYFSEIVAAANELGSRWARSNQPPLILNWDEHTGVQAYWPPFYAAIVEDRAAIKQLLGIGGSEQRMGAIQVLSSMWPDESTRELLRARAVEDQDRYVRVAAVQLLAAKWPDDSTRELLRTMIRHDQEKSDRGWAFSVLGGMHSQFGNIVGTRDLDGTGPYLDPREPLPPDHIQEAAEKAGIAAADLEEQIASLNQHLGWDITVGACPAPAPKKVNKKRPRGSK